MVEILILGGLALLASRRKPAQAGAAGPVVEPGAQPTWKERAAPGATDRAARAVGNILVGAAYRYNPIMRPAQVAVGFVAEGLSGAIWGTKEHDQSINERAQRFFDRNPKAPYWPTPDLIHATMRTGNAGVFDQGSFPEIAGLTWEARREYHVSQFAAVGLDPVAVRDWIMNGIGEGQIEMWKGVKPPSDPVGPSPLYYDDQGNPVYVSPGGMSA